MVQKEKRKKYAYIARNPFGAIRKEENFFLAEERRVYHFARLKNTISAGVTVEIRFPVVTGRIVLAAASITLTDLLPCVHIP